jgi:RES domain-containing protein
VIARPPPRLDGAVLAWRLDRARHAAAWDSGEGAFRLGGRWNGKGVRAVYCALDPATAILEVAVHKGFRVLDTEPHVLTALALPAAGAIRVLAPEEVPNPHWLVPGIPSAGQQAFGSALLAAHGMVAVPSVVSRHSWNLVFDAARTAGRYALAGQERFALDPRLHPAGG